VKIIRVNVRLIEANLRQWQRQDGKPFLPAPKNAREDVRVAGFTDSPARMPRRDRQRRLIAESYLHRASRTMIRGTTNAEWMER
jgi:hypothetical protein